MGEKDLEQYPSHQEKVWEQEESGGVSRELESDEGECHCQGFEGDGEFREEPDTQEWVENGAEEEDMQQSQYWRQDYENEEVGALYRELTSPFECSCPTLDSPYIDSAYLQHPTISQEFLQAHPIPPTTKGHALPTTIQGSCHSAHLPLPPKQPNLVFGLMKPT